MRDNVYKPKSTKEAIDLFQDFLECDLYSKFRPEIRVSATRNGKKTTAVFYREDAFKNEDDFIKYLGYHFGILRKELKELMKKNGKK